MRRSVLRVTDYSPPTKGATCVGCGTAAYTALCDTCAKKLEPETLSTIENLIRKAASAPAGKFGFATRQLEIALEDAGKQVRRRKKGAA